MQPQDWNPRSAEVLSDQRAAGDAMRESCPVAYSDMLGWSVFRHEDVVRILHDPVTFSNVVSRNLAVPNGMDPPEHDQYRPIIESYFSPLAMETFEPTCRCIADELVGSFKARRELELMADFAYPFAVQVQCAFLGWPQSMHENLLTWSQRSQAATAAHDRIAMAAVAQEFAGYVQGLLQQRRDAGFQASLDVTRSLANQHVKGRLLSDEEIVGVLRNWTVGEISTIAAAIGVVAQFLAENTDVQQQLRTQPSLLDDAIDEILRLHGPLFANRRLTTRKVEIGGRTIAAGERISLQWVSANRDSGAFTDSESFRLDRDAGANLLYGAGIHVCPGAPLARMELRLAIQALLGATTRIALIAHRAPIPAVYPASGFTAVPVQADFAL